MNRTHDKKKKPDHPVSTRPLSPHLGIYKLPMTAILSITHRFAGIGIAKAMVLFGLWIMAAAWFPAVFDWTDDFLSAWYSVLLLYILVFVLFYEIFHGIRHIMWDMGYGYDLKTANTTGYMIIGGAVFMTVLVWLC